MSAESEVAAEDTTPWKRMLAARPVQNVKADVRRPEGWNLKGPRRSDDEAEALEITVSLKRAWYLLVPPLSWIVRVGSTRTLRLDRLGARVWDLCDGKRTVEKIVDEFAELYGLSFHEARTSVTIYLKMLVQRGALAIVM